jgi:hypothetical protein
MSREIENITNAFHKAREEGAQMLADGRICWEDFCEVMRGYENQLQAAGIEL